jgi:hypothetical protein
MTVLWHGKCQVIWSGLIVSRIEGEGGGHSMYKALIKLSALSLLLGVAPAMAADFSEANPVVSPPAAAPSPSNTFSFEFDPEFQQAPSKLKPKPGDGQVSDYLGKFTAAHTFSSGVVVSGFFQPQYDLHPGGTNAWRYYTEGDLGYKIKMNDSFTLTPSAGIGGVWGDTQIKASKTNVNPSAVYYALYLAGDLKLNSNWTWNVFNLRYRDAFSYTWITPKVATGITYNINKYSALYGTVGYSWKETTGTPLNPSVLNIGAGVKANF